MNNWDFSCQYISSFEVGKMMGQTLAHLMQPLLPVNIYFTLLLKPGHII